MLRITGHTAAVFSVAFAPDGQHIATGSLDQTARIWDTTVPAARDTLSGHSDWIYGVAFSPDGTRLVSGSSDGTARLWDVASGALLLTIDQPSGVSDADFSPDGRMIVTAAFDDAVRLWDAETGALLRELPGYVQAFVAFTPDGRYLLVSGGEEGTSVWDVASWEQVREFPVGGFMAVSPDGRSVATSGPDHMVVWEVETGRELTRIGSEPIYYFPAFSPDGTELLTGTNEHTAVLWDIQTGERLRTFTGHTQGVLEVAFSSDGRYVLTSGEDRTARLWETGTGRQVRTFAGYGNTISAIAVSPDDRHIAIADSGGAVQLATLDLDELIQSVCRRVLRDFTPEERIIYSTASRATSRPAQMIVTRRKQPRPTGTDRLTNEGPIWLPTPGTSSCAISPLTISTMSSRSRSRTISATLRRPPSSRSPGRTSRRSATHSQSMRATPSLAS
jgi:WD40 repeat protein